MSAESHLVPHGVAVKKHAAGAAIADLVGLDGDRVEGVLAGAVSGGRATRAGAAYALTPAGRLIVEAQYSRYYAQARADAEFAAAHARFEVLNTALKQVITDWQLVTVGGRAIANDHADAAHDAAVVSRLAAVHDQIEPILVALARRVGRLARYREKLAHALERAEDGERAWVSDAHLDSYHTVWFELHEDLLRVLGQERVE